MKKQIALKIKKDFGESADLIVRPARIGGKEAFFFALEGLTDKEMLEERVIKPLSKEDPVDFDKIDQCVYLSSPVKRASSFREAENAVAEGFTALAVEGKRGFYLFPAKKWERRSVEEPPTSSVIKGPREGFTEDVSVNAALLRRRIKNRSLVIREMTIGKYTSSKVLICYLSDVAAKKTVDLVTERLSHVEIDGVIDSSYLTKFLEDEPSSLFPQVGSFEKPDVVAAKLLEGRVAIIVDNSPIVLTVPYVYIEDVQSSNDYYTNYIFGTNLEGLDIFGKSGNRKGYTNDVLVFLRFENAD